jgi:hypothetical protein
LLGVCEDAAPPKLNLGVLLPLPAPAPNIDEPWLEAAAAPNGDEEVPLAVAPAFPKRPPLEPVFEDVPADPNNPPLDPPEELCLPKLNAIAQGGNDKDIAEGLPWANGQKG